jgi:signal transduction histidine kinase
VLTVVDVDEDVARRLQVKAADLVQLAREAVSNVARHARATTCRVSLVRDQTRAVLEIDDDGRGFDETAPTSGLGLGRLRDRAAMIGGELEVRSGPASGTCIRVLMPL